MLYRVGGGGGGGGGWLDGGGNEILVGFGIGILGYYSLAGLGLGFGLGLGLGFGSPTVIRQDSYKTVIRQDRTRHGTPEADLRAVQCCVCLVLFCFCSFYPRGGSITAILAWHGRGLVWSSVWLTYN